MSSCDRLVKKLQSWYIGKMSLGFANPSIVVVREPANAVGISPRLPGGCRRSANTCSACRAIRLDTSLSLAPGEIQRALTYLRSFPVFGCSL